MYSVFSLITIDFPKNIHKDVAYQSEENLNKIPEKINDNSIVSGKLYIDLNQRDSLYQNYMADLKWIRKRTPYAIYRI